MSVRYGSLVVDVASIHLRGLCSLPPAADGVEGPHDVLGTMKHVAALAISP